MVPARIRYLITLWSLLGIVGQKSAPGMGKGGGGGGGGGELMHPIGSLQREYDFLSLRFFSRQMYSV